MKKNIIAKTAIVAGYLMNATATIMAFVQAFKVIGFGQLMMMNELGMWIQLFKADAGYSWLIVGISLMGLVVFMTGKVLDQMVKDEIESKTFQFSYFK